MARLPDDDNEVIEQARAREVAAIFHSCAALNDAVEDLLHNGFDRADIDIIGDLLQARQGVGYAYIAAEELPEVPQLPRRPFFARDDVAAVVAVVAGVASGVGALAAAYRFVTSGIASTITSIVAIVCGLLAGLIAALFAIHFIRRANTPDPLLEYHGIVLWVRVHTSEQEDRAQRILLQNGGEAVRVHEIEIGKRLADIPLSSLRPIREPRLPLAVDPATAQPREGKNHA